MKTKGTQKKNTTLGARRRNGFLTRAQQLRALDAVAGAWKDKDHPELKQGAAKWIKKIRQESAHQREPLRHDSYQRQLAEANVFGRGC